MHFPTLHWTFSFYRKESQKKLFGSRPLRFFFRDNSYLPEMPGFRGPDCDVLLEFYDDFAFVQTFRAKPNSGRLSSWLTFTFISQNFYDWLTWTVFVLLPQIFMTYLYISVLGLVHRNMVNSHQGLSRIAC